MNQKQNSSCIHISNEIPKYFQTRKKMAKLKMLQIGFNYVPIKLQTRNLTRYVLKQFFNLEIVKTL